MPAWLTGLLGGINTASDVNRAERLRKEEQQERFERDLLAKIADDPQYTTDIRTRAATGLLELAQGTRTRPRGGFLSRLTGVDPIEAHPAVTEIFRFMQSPEEKGGGLPTGLARTRPQPQTAPVPGSAAMPTTPATQPGGGPSPSQLPSPGGPPPSPSLPSGPLPIDETTGAPMQGPPSPGIQVPRQIMRTPQEMAIEASRARYYGEIQGKIDALVAAGMPLEDARATVQAEFIRGSRGAGSIRPLRGTDANGNPVTVIVDNRPGSPTMGKFLDADTMQPVENFMMASTSGSFSAGALRESVAMATYGRRYSELQPAQQRVVLDLETQQLQDQSYARGMGTGTAAGDIPLSTNQRWQATQDLSTRWQKEQAADRAARQAYAQISVGLRRFKEGDTAGGSEAVRVGFEKLLDPISVVREGEFNRQTMGLSLFQRMEGEFQRLFSGGGPIPLAQLEAMVATAGQFAQLQTQYLPQLAKDLNAKATRWGLDPTDVMGGYQVPGAAPGGPPPAPAPSAPAAPAPGMAGAPPPAPGATAPVTTQGQGGPPSIPTQMQPNAPQQGEMVGNRWTGPVRFNYRTQRWIGEMPDGSYVVLTKTPAGDFLY